MNIKINMLDIRLNDAVGLLLVVGTFAIGVIACDAVPTEMVSTIRRQAVCTTASKHPPSRSACSSSPLSPRSRS